MIHEEKRCCRCHKITTEEEKPIMIKVFIVFMVIQTIVVALLCAVSIYYIDLINMSWFLPVDVKTMMIAVIILGLLLLVLGWTSATSNTWFAWLLFHAFMIVLLLLEMIICYMSSNTAGFIKIAQNTWYSPTDIADLSEIQNDLKCCGFVDADDHPAPHCPVEATEGCKTKLSNVMNAIRNTASVALFIDIVFAMFIDFTGCAICFHPELIKYNEHDEEERLLPANSSMDALSRIGPDINVHRRFIDT